MWPWHCLFRRQALEDTPGLAHLGIIDLLTRLERMWPGCQPCLDGQWLPRSVTRCGCGRADCVLLPARRNYLSQRGLVLREVPGKLKQPCCNHVIPPGQRFAQELEALWYWTLSKQKGLVPALQAIFRLDRAEFNSCSRFDFRSKEVFSEQALPAFLHVALVHCIVLLYRGLEDVQAAHLVCRGKAHRGPVSYSRSGTSL